MCECVVWHGTVSVWCGMVRCGVVWCGVVWCVGACIHVCMNVLYIIHFEAFRGCPPLASMLQLFKSPVTVSCQVCYHCTFIYLKMLYIFPAQSPALTSME